MLEVFFPLHRPPFANLDHGGYKNCSRRSFLFYFNSKFPPFDNIRMLNRIGCVTCSERKLDLGLWNLSPNKWFLGIETLEIFDLQNSENSWAPCSNAGGIWKRRSLPENASNIFRPLYTTSFPGSLILPPPKNETVPTTLGRENTMSLFSKSSIFKLFRFEQCFEKLQSVFETD